MYKFIFCKHTFCKKYLFKLIFALFMLVNISCFISCPLVRKIEAINKFTIQFIKPLF